jgi:ParB family chromosome partitioning protein
MGASKKERELIGQRVQAVTAPAPQWVRQVLSLPMSMVRPDPEQPRKVFDAESMAALEASIKKIGQVQPILVRSDIDADTGEPVYWIVAGERRFRAMCALGMEKIDAVVVNASQAPAVVALVENMARADLTVIEEARGIRRVAAELGYSQLEMAELLGRQRSEVSRLWRVADLPEEMIERVVAVGGNPRGFLLELVDLDEEERVAAAEAALAAGDLTRAFLRAWKRRRSTADAGAAGEQAVDAIGVHGEEASGLEDAGTADVGADSGEVFGASALADREVAGGGEQGGADGDHGMSTSAAAAADVDDVDAEPSEVDAGVMGPEAEVSEVAAFLDELAALVKPGVVRRYTLRTAEGVELVKRTVEVLVALLRRSGG